MLRQIIVAMAGAIAAQLTAATLSFTPAEQYERTYYEPRRVAPLAVIAGSPHDVFAMPSLSAGVTPFLSPQQVAVGR